MSPRIWLPSRSEAFSPGTRLALSVFVLLLVFDGAIRKWLFPGAEQAIFVIKDALLLATFSWSLMQRQSETPSHVTAGAKLLLVAYAFWVAFESFNPRLPNVLVGMWGMRAHLLYVILIVLIPLAFRDLRDLFSSLEKGYPWIVIPVVSLALLQLAAPSTSVLNQAVRGDDEYIAEFGYAGLVRVSGTFSYISGMAAFVQASTLLGIALFLSGARSRVFLVGLAFALLAVPVTGSRGVVVVTIIGTVVLLIASAICRFVSGSYALLATGVLVALGAFSIQSQDVAWQALSERAEGAHGDENRAITVFTNAFEYFGSSGPVGFGAGSANNGAPVLVKGQAPFSWLPFGNQFEEESGRIVIELGVIGWFINLGMRVVFAWWAGLLALRGSTPAVRAGAVLALPVVLLGLQQGNGVFAPPVGATFYWFAIAILAMAEYENRVALKTRLAARVVRRHAVAAR